MVDFVEFRFVIDWGVVVEGCGGSVSMLIGSFVYSMVSVFFYLFKGDVMVVEFFINGFEEVLVEYRFVVMFVLFFMFLFWNLFCVVVNGVLRVI